VPTLQPEEVVGLKKNLARFAGAIGWLVALMMAAGAGWKPH
jgi:hypothetical protein